MPGQRRPNASAVTGGGVLAQQVPKHVKVNGAVHDRIGKQAGQEVDVRPGLTGAAEVANGLEIVGHEGFFLDGFGTVPRLRYRFTVSASTFGRALLGPG
jgi:hypothetical protein